HASESHTRRCLNEKADGCTTRPLPRRADRRISARSSGIAAFRRGSRRRMLRGVGTRRLLPAVRRAASRSCVAAAWRSGRVANLERAALLLVARRVELDLENAIAEGRRRGVGVGAFGQRYRAVE